MIKTIPSRIFAQAWNGHTSMKWHKGCNARHNLWMILWEWKVCITHDVILLIFCVSNMCPQNVLPLWCIPLIWSLFTLTNRNIWFSPSILAVIQLFIRFHFACYWIFIVKNQLIRSTIITKDYQVPWFTLSLLLLWRMKRLHILNRNTWKLSLVNMWMLNAVLMGFGWIVPPSKALAWKMDQLEDHGAWTLRLRTGLD